MTTLEFDLPPAESELLTRSPPLRGVRLGRIAAAPCRIVWHDTPEGALARHGCTLAESRDGWRLERLWPAAAATGPDATCWAPATPPPVLAQADLLPALTAELQRLGADAGLMPIAAFEGVRRRAAMVFPGASGADPATAAAPAAEPGTLLMLDGVLRSVAAEEKISRCQFSGDAAPIAALAAALAGDLHLRVPRHSLAARGRALARGEPPPPRRMGAPGVAPGQSVGGALAGLTSHLVDVILQWVPLIATDQAEEAVHQTRVAVRRLRSALSLFARAVPCPALDQARRRLQQFALRLGPARDWDVFLGGTGQALAASLPDDARVTALLAAAERRRAAVHAALLAWLDSAELRQLEVELACLAALRPWEAAAQAPAPAVEPVAADADAAVAPDQAVPEDAQAATDPLAQPCRAFACHVLARQTRRMLQDGTGIATMTVPALHSLRKDGKRLRYAVEFFAPLFPAKTTRRFLRRMAPLQEALGHLNDAAVADTLMRDLGRGPGRAFATGAVAGFIAGRAGRLRRNIAAAWEDFSAAEPFWE